MMHLVLRVWRDHPRSTVGVLAVMVIAIATLGAATVGPAAPSPSPSPSPTEIAASPGPTAPSPSPLVTPSPSPSPSPSPTPEVFYAALDGMPTTAELATRIPTAVMIDDNIPARPQSGFTQASIVYHAPADGGETRYMFVYQENDAPVIGPVRSARPYFVRWAAEYRSVFAHYGGDRMSWELVGQIDRKLVFSLNALSGAGGAYYRVKWRVAPHNAYTSSDRLDRLADRRDFPSEMLPGLGARIFQDDAPEAERPAKAFIRIPYRTGRIDYSYDQASNSYRRSIAGKAQFDAETEERVTARNIIVLWIRLTIDSKIEPGYHRPVFHVVGKGKAIVFRDGQAIRGTWVKHDDGDLTRIVDESGDQIPLVRGPIYIQVVPLDTDVDYG